jgi:hypothetical protein
MHEQRPPALHLDDSQRTRLEFAHRDLDEIRAADLAALDAAALILYVERLRARLDDVLRIIDETHSS